MRLSQMIEEMGISSDCELIDEREFDCLARITSCVEGRRCVFLSERKYLHQIPENAVMVITYPELKNNLEGMDVGLCLCNEPKGVYYSILNHMADVEGQKVPTIIAPNCKISDAAYIAPFNVVIGENTVVEDGAHIYENTMIGENCWIACGAGVGVYSFNSYIYKGERIMLKAAGKTKLGDNVYIGRNAQVGRAVYSYNATTIGDGTKIYDLASVGHEAVIGKNTLVYMNVMLSGNVHIGDGCSVYTSAAVKNGIRIGNHVTVDMGSVVIHDVQDNQKVFGNPAKLLLTPRCRN